MIDHLKKEEILNRAKQWYKNVIQNHITKLEKLTDPSVFKINPFTVKYISKYFTPGSDPTSIAKALIFPRALGTSISTSLGTNMQNFIVDVLGALGSTTSGMDIEFIDHTDGRKKYCQVKSGPQTINKDDIKTIIGHFDSVRNLAKTNRSIRLEFDDMIVGVLYGERDDLNNFYKKLEKDYHYPVYIGNEFWTRLTGDPSIYQEFIVSINEVLTEFTDLDQRMEKIISQLATSEIVKDLAKK